MGDAAVGVPGRGETAGGTGTGAIEDKRAKLLSSLHSFQIQNHLMKLERSF